MKENIIPHTYNITQEQRRSQLQQNSLLLWFTGLSGSGKSTIANAVEQQLFDNGIKTYCLDGDNIRKGINKDLTFSPKDRKENIRRIAEVANLMVDAGLVVLAAFVSPYKKDREAIRSIVKDVNFVEIYVDTSLEECERRDVKGLYQKARKGEIKNMTVISSPYEAQSNTDVHIKTENITINEAVDKIITYVDPKLKYRNE